MSNRAYPSKVLLFGEYSIIKGSSALCLPYNLFDGSLKFRRDNQKSIDSELKAFSSYLKILTQKNEVSLDTNSFEFDVSQGLYFDSTIPQGFGVGSSGALVAAVYDRYCDQKTSNNDLTELKRIFSLMESHFHGSSSGIDPLISYLEESVLIENDGNLRVVETQNNPQGNSGIFLLNTGRTRRTEPLVNLFLEKCNSDSFNDLMINLLKPTTDACITHFLERDIANLKESFQKLSTFQYENFSQMIPTLFKEIWKEGLDSGEFSLKLCGAGGGGFILGFTQDMANIGRILTGHEIRPLFKI